MIKKEFNTIITSLEPIVDVEFCNDITNPNGGDWFYNKADVVTVGLIEDNKVTILQREKTDKKEDFVNKVKELLSNLPKFYSFNYNMEKGALEGYFNLKPRVEEIKPWKGSGWNKDKFFEKVKSMIKIYDKLDDPLKGDGSLVQSKYSEEKYEEIIMHNYNCLVKEAHILKFRDLMIEENKQNIDQKGWLKEKI